MAKAAYWTVNDAEARKRGEQTGLDTLVVPELSPGDVYKRQPTHTSSPPFSTDVGSALHCLLRQLQPGHG